jgi:hypothetical protein
MVSVFHSTDSGSLVPAVLLRSRAPPPWPRQHQCRCDERKSDAAQAFIDEMRRNPPVERFRREFEAEFVEDETAYVSHDLITRCIGLRSQFIPDAAFGF